MAEKEEKVVRVATICLDRTDLESILHLACDEITVDENGSVIVYLDGDIVGFFKNADYAVVDTYSSEDLEDGDEDEDEDEDDLDDEEDEEDDEDGGGGPDLDPVTVTGPSGAYFNVVAPEEIPVQSSNGSLEALDEASR